MPTTNGGTLSVGGSGDLTSPRAGSNALVTQNGGVVTTTNATSYGGLWVANDIVDRGTYHLINGSVTIL